VGCLEVFLDAVLDGCKEGCLTMGGISGFCPDSLRLDLVSSTTGMLLF